jgi:hypothetical protein
MAVGMAAALLVKLEALEREGILVPVAWAELPMVTVLLVLAAAAVADRNSALAAQLAAAVVLASMGKAPAVLAASASMVPAAAAAVAAAVVVVPPITVVRAAQPIFMAATAGLTVVAAGSGQNPLVILALDPQELFALYGLAPHGYFHQLMLEFHKWNFTFKSVTDSLMSIPSWATTSAKRFLPLTLETCRLNSPPLSA